jgi:two-component system LytT family response regulator
MITAVLIDDESAGRGIIVQNLKRYFLNEIEIVGEADSVKSGVMIINKVKPQLVFLDIQMHDGTGFDLLDMLPKIDFALVFVTSFDQYAIRAIRYSALDYLLKPVDPDEFQIAVNSALDKLQQENHEAQIRNVSDTNQRYNKLALPSQEGVYMVNVDDIIRCESDNNYTRFFIVGGAKYLVSRTLKEYDDLLTDKAFCRVHKSHLINLNHVVKYVQGEGGYLILSEDHMVDVSRRRKENLLKKLF